MLRIDDNKIYITRGDGGSFDVAMENEDGTAYDYSGETVVFSVKKSPYDSKTLIQKTVTDGKVTLTASDTFLPFGSYFYDLVITSKDLTVIPPTMFTVGEEVHYETDS